MFDLIFFLGFQPDTLFEKRQEQINPHLFSLLTSGGDYLQVIYNNGQKFYGKMAPPYSTLEQLEYLEANISSLLKKLLPDYPLHKNPLRLIATTH